MRMPYATVKIFSAYSKHPDCVTGLNTMNDLTGRLAQSWQGPSSPHQHKTFIVNSKTGANHGQQVQRSTQVQTTCSQQPFQPKLEPPRGSILSQLPKTGIFHTFWTHKMTFPACQSLSNHCSSIRGSFTCNPRLCQASQSRVQPRDPWFARQQHQRQTQNLPKWLWLQQRPWSNSPRGSSFCQESGYHHAKKSPH